MDEFALLSAASRNRLAPTCPTRPYVSAYPWSREVPHTRGWPLPLDRQGRHPQRTRWRLTHLQSLRQAYYAPPLPPWASPPLAAPPVSAPPDAAPPLSVPPLLVPPSAAVPPVPGAPPAPPSAGGGSSPLRSTKTAKASSGRILTLS